MFTAPEIHNQMNLKKNAEKIDFSKQYSWEVGCLLYEMAFGCFPFEGYPALFGEPPNLQVPPPSMDGHLPGVSNDFLEVIRRMLTSNPVRRIPYLQAADLIEKSK